MAAKKDTSARLKEIRNAKVFRDFFVEDRFEAGIMLTGTEVKSIRAGRAQISDAFGRVERTAVFLHNIHISEYEYGNIHNHNPYRPRKLLLHRREIEKMAAGVSAGGLAVVPIRLFFKQGLVKVEIGLCKGKMLYDKREDLKEKAHQQEMRRALKTMQKPN